jgi:type II secretory pathway pseudopilin PulG
MTIERSPLRRGFTAVELIIVIGIMMILLGIAVPSVMPAIRRGKVNDAANDITDCWRQARALAIQTPLPPAQAGGQPPYFGIAIDQTTGQRPYVEIIFDSTAAGTQAYTRGMDPRDPSTWSGSGTPVSIHTFSQQVILQTTPLAGGAASTADRHVVIYAQYGTGLPIDPATVVLGQGQIAAPTSMGVSSPSIGTQTVCPVLQIQTLDFDNSSPATKRGYAVLFQLFHAGFTSVQELQ